MLVLQMLEPLLGFVGELICHYFAGRVAEEAMESWYPHKLTPISEQHDK